MKWHKWSEWEKVNEVKTFCQETSRVSLLLTHLKTPNDSSSKYIPNFTELILWLKNTIFLHCKYLWLRTMYDIQSFRLHNIEIAVWPAVQLGLHGRTLPIDLESTMKIIRFVVNYNNNQRIGNVFFTTIFLNFLKVCSSILGHWKITPNPVAFSKGKLPGVFC